MLETTIEKDNLILELQTKIHQFCNSKLIMAANLTKYMPIFQSLINKKELNNSAILMTCLSTLIF